ncbi:hypothetical protein PENDEC_c002G02766 [Penicillium decumbens]|uniref:F-box domain-containing protein n=1 Tax=Penicillium decumbens TaxID=69771 RepID=A0A1V6PKV4_PENDC|nr:hypothetical protein PENDEC_c002G02766 [Penicillium decumbens]
MSSNVGVRLPPEIILIITEQLWSLAEWDENGDALMARQRRMKSFCLVSHEWYTAGIALLYLCPELRTKDSFDKFVETVSQSNDANHMNIDFGSMVYVLRLGQLHDIADDQFERLLSRLHANLISLEAPPTSFSLKGPAVLSMCKNLEQMDLSLLTDTRWSKNRSMFPDIKQAISGLPKLVSVSLPLEIRMHDADQSLGDWPCSLQSIKIGGALDPTVMRKLQWPSHPFKLTIRHCRSLRTTTLEGIFDNENIRDHLTRLYIDHSNNIMFDDAPTGILYSLRNLVHLRVPLDFAQDFIMLPFSDHPLPIRVLELTEPYSGQVLKEFTQLLFRALDSCLRNTLALGICELPSNLWNGQVSSLSSKLLRRVQGSPQTDLSSIERLGLYALDEPRPVPTQ